MKKIQITLLGMLMVITSFGQYDPEALAVLDAMSAKYKSFSAFKATFNQKLTNKQAGLDETRTGSIIVKGSKYGLVINEFQAFNNGKIITTFNEDLMEVNLSNYEPSEESISVNNVYDIYKEGYKYNLMTTNQNGDRVVELDPEDKSLPVFKLRMIIDAKDELKSFIVFERDGNQYTYTISDFEETTVADNYFDYFEGKFDTYKQSDSDVIDVVDFTY